MVVVLLFLFLLFIFVGLLRIWSTQHLIDPVQLAGFLILDFLFGSVGSHCLTEQAYAYDSLSERQEKKRCQKGEEKRWAADTIGDCGCVTSRLKFECAAAECCKFVLRVRVGFSIAQYRTAAVQLDFLRVEKGSKASERLSRIKVFIEFERAAGDPYPIDKGKLHACRSNPAVLPCSIES